ncbi:MAG: hypothetical protein HY890_06345 [Deltaproteobacteria bacterium]|nr:hypothetical protein [Deltaproteobacteria bacterium]
MFNVFTAFITLAIVSLNFIQPSFAGDAPSRDTGSVKGLIIRLDKEYRLLNEELRKLDDYVREFPATTLNLTVTKGDVEARLVSVEIRDNDRLVASHIYTSLENDAMRAGGRHQIYDAETSPGVHRFRAVYYWTDGDGRPPKKGEAEITVSVKPANPNFVEFSLQKKGVEAELRPREFEFIR